jgi:Protein of unknown function (DUF1501)
MNRLTRRSLLLSGAAATLLPARVVRAADSSAPKYLVVLFVNGGWDVTFAMDPKPVDGNIDGPWLNTTSDPDDVEELRVINGIPVQTNDFKRKSVTAFFETWGDRACVVNGIWTGSIVHQPSRTRMLTGTTDPMTSDAPTIIGASKGVSVDLPLGSVDFSGLGHVGQLAATTGRTGASSQLKALLDPTVSFPAPSWADYVLPTYQPTSNEEDAVRAHLESRIAAYRGKFGASTHNSQLLDDLLESNGRRQRLVQNAELISGRLNLGSAAELDLQADIAVDLLAGGVCHTVTIGDPEPGWDTHDGNVLQHDKYSEAFAALNKLLDGLQTAKILDVTTIVMMSEMTRTPKVNWKGGKDHWAHTSQIWIGAGVRGSTVVGATDDYLESLPVDLASGDVTTTGELNKYDNMVAGLLQHMGVDSEEYLPGVVPFRGATA